jgi:5'-nucleotidase
MRSQKLFIAILLCVLSSPVYALNILLTNDDGLTSNVKALYTALDNAGHDVIVVVPCYGQSGMGAAVRFLRPITPLEENCLNNAASAGEAGAGPVSKAEDGFDYTDFYYVDGTPVMAAAYGLDVVAQARWGAVPNVVLSGPNEGQNVGGIVISSGTVSNAQFAASRGLVAIALSAGSGTAGEEDEQGNHADNPLSETVAALSVELIAALEESANGGRLLPEGTALNVNFPDEPTPETTWSFTQIGSYNSYQVSFVEDLSQDPVAQGYGLAEAPYPGVTIGFNTDEPSEDQLNDEAFVYREKISITPMQVAYDQPSGQAWLRENLGGLVGQE